MIYPPKLQGLLLVGLLPLLLLSACTAINGSDTGEQLLSVQQTIQVLEVQATQTGAAALAITPHVGGQVDTPTPAVAYKDLTIRPQIWFSPLDPMSLDRYYPGQGPFEFYDLFQSDAPWRQASDAVQVIKLYGTWTEDYSTPEQLSAVIADITARGMAISFELGPLQENGACNAATIEGFSGKPVAVKIANRIKSVGGTLYSFDMEHGFDAASYYDLPCRMTPHQIAEDAAITVNALRQIFPDVKIGSIETANMDVDDVAAWMQAYRDVMDEELDYFDLDINFEGVDWAERAREIEAYVESRGVEFGIFYRGNHYDETDLEWINHAEERFVEYEVKHGGTPDHVIFQSWDAHPLNLIPETETGTFTNLILRYLRTRTHLLLNLANNVAIGVLQTEDGQPVSRSEIEIFAVPLDGDGLVAEYTITGTVPADATLANVGFRVNMECDCQGPAAFKLEQVSYTEGNQTSGKVPNGSFGNGLNGWGLWGSGIYQLVSSPFGNGSALEVETSMTSDAGANSDTFTVTPGERFIVTFTAQVSPLTDSAGYFSLFFLNAGGEVARYTLPIEAGQHTLATGLTQPDGSFNINLGEFPSGHYQFGAWYPGSEVYWPALQTISNK